jgi:FkbM family methyltransferase
MRKTGTRMRLKVWTGRAWRNINRKISRLYVSCLIKDSPVPLVRYGHGEGSWMAPEKIPNNAIIYCGGVGVDASFDFDLKNRTNADVHSFDPTPKAIEYMEMNNGCGVSFHPWGMLDRDAVVRFYDTLSDEQQSYSDLHNTGKFTELKCYKISSIMKELNHNHIYLLKIDIEGSWYQVLIDMTGDSIFPDFINVEFDSPAPIWRVRPVMSVLAAAGYAPVFRERDNVVLVRYPEK